MRDSKRDTDVLNSLLDSVGEGKGRMIWENGIETCKLYVKRIASPGWMHETGCSGLVRWDDPEGRDAVGGGSERVTGRKARGLQMEERGCKCQTFLSLLSGRKKQTMSFLLYTNLKEGFS